MIVVIRLEVTDEQRRWLAAFLGKRGLAKRKDIVGRTNFNFTRDLITAKTFYDSTRDRRNDSRKAARKYLESRPEPQPQTHGGSDGPVVARFEFREATKGNPR